MEVDIYDNSFAPCKRGHTDGRYLSTSRCVTCAKISSRMQRDPQYKDELTAARQALKDFNHPTLAALELTQAYLLDKGRDSGGLDSCVLKLKADWQALQEAVACLERYA